MKRTEIRLPDGMAARIEAAAEREKRSLNGQLVWLLQLALDAQQDKP